MAHISEFRAKWEFYKPRAPRLSPHFAGFQDGQAITQPDVAAKIPKSTQAAVPADEDDHIAGAAFGNWLGEESVPDNRVRQWESLTNLSIDVWTSPRETFERTLRQRLGEVLGWSGLVRGKAVRGPLRVRPRDRDPQSPQVGHMRFVPPDYDPAARPVEVQYVWPGCVADIAIPAREPRDDEDRRAWLLADYGGREAYMLDPAKPGRGEPVSSRIDRRCWRPNRQGDRAADGHVVVPRSWPGHVWIPPSTPLGTTFEAIGLTLNLTNQTDETRALFDALEQRWRVDPREVAKEDYQRTVRAALDEAAALIAQSGVGVAIFAQTCEVVERAKAKEAGHG